MEFTKIISPRFILICLSAILVITVLFYIANYFIGDDASDIPQEIANVNIYTSTPAASSATNVPANEIAVLPNFALDRNTPNIANIYKYQKANSISENQVNEFNEKFNLSEIYRNDNPDSGLKIVSTSADKHSSLTAEMDKKRITYTNSNIDHPIFDQGENVEKYTQFAKELMKQLEVNDSIFQFESYRYLSTKDTNEPQTARTDSERNLIELVYLSKIGEFPIYDKSGELSPNKFIVWYNSSEVPVKIIYEPVGIVGEKIGTTNIKDRAKVIEDLNIGKGKLIETSVLNPTKITQTVLQKGDFGYIGSNGYLIPMFSVSGISNTYETQYAGQSYFLLGGMELE